MIEAQLSGDFPTIEGDPIGGVMGDVAQLMEESILANIAAGGRPDPWLPRKKDGGKALQGFARDISSRHDATTAEAGVFSAQPKHWVAQNGAIIKHPGSDKLQVFTIDGVTVFTHHTAPHDIPEPRRMFVLFQEDDITAIVRLVSDAIFRGVKNEPINY